VGTVVPTFYCYFLFFWLGIHAKTEEHAKRTSQKIKKQARASATTQDHDPVQQNQ